MDIFSPIESIKRISPAYQKRLQKLGVKTLRDLFYHFPFRYDDFSIIKPIAQLKLNEVATIQGEIIDIKNTRTWKKRMFITEAYIQDQTGIIRAVWFNQPFLINTLKIGQIVSVSGKVNFDKTLYFSNPAHERLFAIDSQLRHTGGLIPIYQETTGLTSRWLRYIIKPLLPKFVSQLKDFLPLEIKRSQSLLDLGKAIEQIHFPKTEKNIQTARRRLAFDELFLIQLFVLQQKLKWQKQKALIINFDRQLIKNFVDSLPFKLTNAQRKSAWEILQDLEKSKPMNRLLEGDVGSGKTVVAVMAMLQAAKAGFQVALMAPTEILAQQHFKEVVKLLKGQNITAGLLTGNQASVNNNFVIPAHEPESRSGSRVPACRTGRKPGMTKKILLSQISSNQIQVLIGTHALIQETVRFNNLVLVIVDEQHRFGVAQRAALQKNVASIKDGSINTIPHLLSMTATPIPRTLALSIYGDLDISLLNEMPKGRQEIITKIVAPTDRNKAYEFIRQQIKEDRQVFVICPRIESQTSNGYGNEARIVESQTSDVTSSRNEPRGRQTLNDRRNWDDVKAVKEEYEKLHKIIFPDLKIAMLHGKLKPKEKEKIMTDFKAGETDILVSTSVVEVGVDIPNATVMMIEGAERFGLAQLHQFRGRVGRGQHQSYCFLFTESSSKNTNARLKALISCKNGFELAEKDLEIRGPGEFYGSKQWGLPDLSMASLTDFSLVKNVRQEAQKLILKDSELKNCPLLKKALERFQENVHLE
ncbi:MAG: ATP-dependent DNA helicase RecG [Candidatus Portnoybacteria bacterium]|nr:ATP-dependent DNA helicase RecG [Candidatus Portnoybacteria bacterium]